MTDVETWHKSSHSGGAHQNCLEVAGLPDAVRMRDTQNRAAGYLSFSSAEWSVFLAGVRADEL